jgi:hypothetical protein
MTSETFSQFVQQNQLDPTTLELAMRNYITKKADYMGPEEMRQQLIQQIGDEAEVNRLLAAIAADRASLEGAASMILGQAWEEQGETEQVEKTIQGAKDKLAVIELSILAIVAIYGMYLLATGGKLKEEEIEETQPDGSKKKIHRTIYAPPTAPLQAIVDVISKHIPKGGG